MIASTPAKEIIMTDTANTTAVAIDPIKSAEMLTKAKALFTDGLTRIGNGAGEEVCVSAEDAASIRGGMTEEDNNKFDEYMDEETGRHHSLFLDQGNASVNLRTAMEAFIEDSYLKITNKGCMDPEEKAKVIEPLNASELTIMMDFVNSDVAECIVRTKLRSHGLDPAMVIQQYLAMEAKSAGGVSLN